MARDQGQKNRLEKNYIYVIVKTVELKQVSQGAYIEMEIINIKQECEKMGPLPHLPGEFASE